MALAPILAAVAMVEPTVAPALPDILTAVAPGASSSPGLMSLSGVAGRLPGIPPDAVGQTGEDERPTLPIPEPTTIALLSAGTAGLVLRLGRGRR